MNTVSIIGRMVYEPEPKNTSSGAIVLPIRLAVPRNDKKKTTDFINAKAWGSAAEFITKYFHKGDPIEINGRLQVDSYEKLDGTKATDTYIFVLECGFVMSKGRTEARAAEDHPADQAAEEQPTEQPAEDLTKGEAFIQAAADLPFEI